MKRQGIFTTLFALPLLATLSGCLPQNTQTQGLNNVQTANGPCAPNATADLISTGRSLLAITNSVLQTQQNLSGNSTGYAQQVQAAEHAQKVSQGNKVLDNVESLTGASAAAPCTPTSASR
ncbi:hypothetical protein [Pseudomonas turukhanskensis]|uniref:Lipoprotein n=1 Tax=Pseudomonas turukhanskensis TaxID=1806536 RepID=A0A9W6NGH0_9PSED|nr:hypothetical protein [Pseudomonas turukhanskensis]GLK89696.1 hypothetical protein GCM10017655_27580 [Pseudomonas turukhanskensis]